MLNVAAGIALAVLCFIAILKFLPKGGPWGKMILEASVGGNPTEIRPLNATSSADAPAVSSLVGQSGVAATALFPSGQVTIGGRRYEARLEVGFAEAGTTVRVAGQSEFGLIVEVLS
jgi:membrane-bound serine protease (ClpP class)